MSTYAPVRAEQNHQPDTAVEQAILLMSSFTVEPRGGVPSQWPLQFDSFFSRLCPTTDQQTQEWKQWALCEERTRTAFGFYFINLFRYVFSLHTEKSSSAPILAGRRFPAPHEAWYAKSEEEWAKASTINKVTCESLVTQFLRKANERPKAVCRNTFYLQVALLRQAYFEIASLRAATSNGVNNTSQSIREEGLMLTTQLDSVFSLARTAQPAIRLWKPDIYSLFLLHHVLALIRVYPVSVLCEVAETDGTLPVPNPASPGAQQKQREQARIQIWRASHVLQAVQKGTPSQRQQLVVPYALFISVMFLVRCLRIRVISPS